jgi:hypothetical protein
MKLTFPESFDLLTLEIKPYSLVDLFSAVRQIYPSYNILIYEGLQKGYDFELIGSFDGIYWEAMTIQQLENIETFTKILELRLDMFPIGAGTVGRIALGVGLLGLGLAGVGLLGISSTTLALAGGSLLFTSIFKHPKTDTKKNNEKRSINFSGVINTTGAGVIAPLVFGEVSIGSIVASASIVPYDASI